MNTPLNDIINPLSGKIVKQFHSRAVNNSDEERDIEISTESDSSTEDENTQNEKKYTGTVQSQRDLNGVILPTIDPSSFGNVNVESSSKVQVGSSSSHVYNGTVKIRQIIYTNTDKPNDCEVKEFDLPFQKDKKLFVSALTNSKGSIHRLKNDNLNDCSGSSSENRFYRLFAQCKSAQCIKSRQQRLISTLGILLTLLLFSIAALFILILKPKENINYPVETSSIPPISTSPISTTPTSITPLPTTPKSTTLKSTTTKIVTTSTTPAISTTTEIDKRFEGILVQPLITEGFNISIPHRQGRKGVTFHIRINEDFGGEQVNGHYDCVLVKPNKITNRYVCKKGQILHKGDIIYYWLTVEDPLYYNLYDQSHIVTDYYYENGTIVEDTELTDDLNFYYDNYNEKKLQTNHNAENRDCTSYSITKLYDLDGSSHHACSEELIFEDHFKNSDLLLKNGWAVIERYSKSPDHEFVVYKNSRRNIKVENGLKITPRLLNDLYGDDFILQNSLTLSHCTSNESNWNLCHQSARGWNILPPVSSGRLNTKKFLNFEYGRVEIRAKLPSGDWIYPLLMLEPTSNFKNNSISQIRIASASGNVFLKTINDEDIGGNVLHGDIHLKEPFNKKIKKSLRNNSSLWSDYFHTYEVIWNQFDITFKVDGNDYGSHIVYIPPESSFYLTIALAVGGFSEFPDFCTSQNYVKPWKDKDIKAQYNFYKSMDAWYKSWKTESTSLEVDYVKIWAL